MCLITYFVPTAPSLNISSNSDQETRKKTRKKETASISPELYGKADAFLERLSCKRFSLSFTEIFLVTGQACTWNYPTVWRLRERRDVLPFCATIEPHFSRYRSLTDHRGIRSMPEDIEEKQPAKIRPPVQIVSRTFRRDSLCLPWTWLSCSTDIPLVLVVSGYQVKIRRRPELVARSGNLWLIVSGSCLGG